MKSYIVVMAALALAACAASRSGTTKAPGKENEAVLDFIFTGELVETKRIRLSEPIKYLYVNDWWVVGPTRRGDYLVGFRGRCEELRRRKWTSDMIDIRVSARVLHSDYDTIRGCKIGRIYELTEIQLQELSALGDAPGDDQYVPQAKE